MIRRLKLTIPMLLIILATILAATGIALASMTITRHTHITRIPAPNMSVSADTDLNLPEGVTSGQVTYTVTNTGPITYTVLVSPVTTTGISCALNKNSFVLTPGQSDNVTATLEFTDLALTEGDYWPTFSN